MKIKACKVCGSKLLVKAFSSSDNRNISSDTFIYLKCSVCETLLLDSSLLNKKFFNKYYGDKYYLGKAGLKFNFELKFSKFINYLKKKIIKSALTGLGDYAILDVGAGNFGFLKSIDDVNVDKVGIDIYDGNGLDNTSVKLINADFITHDFGSKKFDVITSWHVIEHIADPDKFLRKIYSLLKSKGIVVISTPNLGSLGYMWFGKDWYHFDAPRHTILFKEKSLICLANKVGFKVMQSINMFYEFPFDLWHSAKKTSFVEKAIIILLYPILKIFDRETITLVLKK